jgi:magnesium transporter
MQITFIEKSETQSFKWIDVYEPTEIELNEIAKVYGLHPYTVIDCLEAGHLPKFERIDNYNFLIVRIFDCKTKQHPSTIQEMTSKVAVFYGDHFLITIHRQKQLFLTELANRYSKSESKLTPEQLLTKILRQSLNTYEQPAQKLADEIDEYERLVFLKNPIPSFQKKLYFIKHQNSISKRIFISTSDVISQIYINQPSSPYIQELRDQHFKIVTICEQNQDDVNNLLNIYLSLSAHKTNEVMKIIAIFSVFFMPATFLVGVYGMNFENMPELKWKYGYYMVWGATIVISLVIFQWFKRKKWL